MTEKQMAWAEKQQERISRIKEDLENIEDLEYVKEIEIVAKVKKHWWEEEKIITLNSRISKEVIIEKLKEKLLLQQTIFDVVKEEDFTKFRCSHKSGSSDCEETSCKYCNCSFDFYDSDIIKILKERASYILEE